MPPLPQVHRIPVLQLTRRYHGWSSFLFDQSLLNVTSLHPCPFVIRGNSSADHYLLGGTSTPTVVNRVAPKTPVTHRKPAFRVKSEKSRQSTGIFYPANKKSVHFDESFEQIRLYLPFEAPLALKSESVPVTNGVTATSLAYSRPCELGEKHSSWFSPSGSYLPTNQPIHLESLALSSTGEILIGRVTVLNLVFQKEVTARFTFDNWKTISEVAAQHHQSHSLSGSVVSDRFHFTINVDCLPRISSRAFHLCLRYRVLGEEYWDNNDGMDYHMNLFSSCI